MSVRRRGPPARRERPTPYWRYRRATEEKPPAEAEVTPMWRFVGCRCPRCGYTTERRWPLCVTAKCPSCGFPFLVRSLRRGSEAVAPSNRILA